MSEINYVNAPPNVSSLVTSFRSMGYTLNTAIADIIDNSIAAFANNINLRFSWNSGDPWISIIDDGNGMSTDELIQAMSWASKNPLEQRISTDLGRFGLGLKTAAFSLCRKLTVFSKKNNNYSCAEWKLDLFGIDSEKPWKLALFKDPFVHRESKIYELYKTYLNNTESGTIVLLTGFDKLPFELKLPNSQHLFDESLSLCIEHISKTFHRFMQKEDGYNCISIFANKNLLTGFDPFNISNPAVTELPCQNMNIENEFIEIQPYILPHHSKVSKEVYQKYAGDKGYLNNQGFYIYRNRRLIISGTWFRLHKKEELSKLIRIKVDIPNTLDHLWDLDIRKSKVSPPECIRNGLKTIIESIIGRGKAVYTKKGRILKTSIISPVWNKKVTKKGIEYSINKEHPLLQDMIQDFDPKKQKSFTLLVKLIENSFPKDSFYRDLSEAPDKVLNDGYTEDELKELLDTYVSLLSPGNDLTSDMIDIIMNTDPFIFYKDQVQEFLGVNNA